MYIHVVSLSRHRTHPDINRQLSSIRLCGSASAMLRRRRPDRRRHGLEPESVSAYRHRHRAANDMFHAVFDGGQWYPASDTWQSSSTRSRPRRTPSAPAPPRGPRGFVLRSHPDIRFWHFAWQPDFSASPKRGSSGSTELVWDHLPPLPVSIAAVLTCHLGRQRLR